MKLARAWAAEGHRVIGADVADLDLPIRSGGGMSNALVAFYRIPENRYTSRLLEVIHREKVDLWIPCSPKVTFLEDATARRVIECRTGCRCITFDPDQAVWLASSESFTKFVKEKGFPVLESHKVQSRDSVHKILHRSPSKSYQISRATPTANDRALILPRRTLSKTYNCVSEIRITADRPWILQQQSRLGGLFADLLVVRGHIQAIQVRRSDATSSSREPSRLDEALTTAVHKLMQSLAIKCGSWFTGHLTVQFMVDEEFDAHSVRHSIYIAGCTPGPTVIERLSRNVPCPIAGYLSVFTSDPVDLGDVKATLCSAPAAKSPTRAVIRPTSFLLFSPLYFALTILEAVKTESEHLLFWRNPFFTLLDPLPWWWEVHVYQPLREVWILVKQTREAKVNGY